MRRARRLLRALWRGQRGLALVEVLVAFFLLFVITLAVLEMLSMAFMVNQAASMRTELAYKAQLVVEQLRIQSAVPGTNVCCPLDSGSDVLIPTGAADTCFQSYWGPGGANIVEVDARYEIRYRLTEIAGGHRRVLVEAVPKATGSFRYLGEQATAVGKAVRYVGEI